MRRAHDIPAAIINLRIAVAETFGANRDTILGEANIRLLRRIKNQRDEFKSD